MAAKVCSNFRRVHGFPELQIMRIEYLDMEGWLCPALFRYYNGS